MRRITLFSHSRITALFVLGVFSAIGTAAARDARIAQVEASLLPLAAEKLGVIATLTERMNAYGVAGLSVAVIDNGKVAWAKGYGVADIAPECVTSRPSSVLERRLW